MSCLPKHILECPQCQSGLNLSDVSDPGTVVCPECEREICHVGLFPLPADDLPAGDKAIDWMLQHEPEPLAAAELPAQVCPWCGRHVGVRPHCPECGCDLEQTGRLLLGPSAEGLDELSCGLLQLQTAGPFSVGARLARLLRLPAGRAIEMEMDRRFVAYLPTSIPPVPGLFPTLGGGIAAPLADDSGDGEGVETTFRSSLWRRFFGGLVVLSCWLVLTLLIGAIAGFGLVLGGGAIGIVAGPAVNTLAMVAAILVTGGVLWSRFAAKLRGTLVVAPQVLTAGGGWLRKRWPADAVTSIELTQESDTERLLVKLTSGRETWCFAFGKESADCAEALRQVCRNAAFVGVDGEIHLPAVPDDSSLARCNLGNTYRRRGWSAVLLGMGVVLWLGPVAVLATRKLLSGEEVSHSQLAYFWLMAFSGLLAIAIGVEWIRKGRRVLKA